MRRVKILVTGRVQGVFFRAATQQQAAKLSIQGFVRNLPNGQVEIVAEGANEALQKLVDWSHKGPRLAKVEKVDTVEIENLEQFYGFEVR